LITYLLVHAVTVHNCSIFYHIFQEIA